MDRLAGAGNREVALVTGASSGIGAALAAALAARGAEVMLLARRQRALERVVGRIHAAGGDAAWYVADVGAHKEVADVVRDCGAKHGRIDLVVNCAGIGSHVPFNQQRLVDIERILRTNVLGAIHVLYYAIPWLRNSHRPAVINVSSIAGRIGQPGEAVYSASKFALTGLSEALTIELGQEGIHVLTVYPTLVATAFAGGKATVSMAARLRARPLDPDYVARRTLQALRRGRHELTLPAVAAGAYAMRAMCPPLLRTIVGWIRAPVTRNETRGECN